MNKRTPETSTQIRAHEKRREHIPFSQFHDYGK
jgi:hypothetical protein